MITVREGNKDSLLIIQIRMNPLVASVTLSRHQTSSHRHCNCPRPPSDAISVLRRR